MEKKSGLIIFAFFCSTQLFSQNSEESPIQHSIGVSFDNWEYNETHTFYSYHLKLNRNNFDFGISLERKRNPYYYFHPADLFDQLLDNYGDRPYYYRDSSFSFYPTGLKLGYSYIFKPEKRLTAYPFLNNYIIRYFKEDIFKEPDPNGNYSDFHYRIRQIQYSTQIGCGFIFKLNSKINFNYEFGLGAYFKWFKYEADYFGKIEKFFWPGFNGFMRISATFLLK